MNCFGFLDRSTDPARAKGSSADAGRIALAEAEQTSLCTVAGSDTRPSPYMQEAGRLAGCYSTFQEEMALSRLFGRILTLS